MDTQISPDIQFRLDAELQKRLVQEAGRRGQDAPSLLRDLLSAVLDNLPPAPDQPRNARTSDAPDAPLPDSSLLDKEQRTTETVESENDSKDRVAAEEWARWEAAGRAATEAAWKELREKGASRIYERDGVVWEERADGTTQPLDLAAAREILAR